MARLFVLILLVDFVLVAMALVECLSAADTAIRGLPRIGWVFAILLLGPVGALAWFVAGRPAVEFRISRSLAPRPVRPAGPDDDPEFLAGLAAAIRTQRARES
jgi:phospholipase D-like protein